MIRNLLILFLLTTVGLFGLVPKLEVSLDSAKVTTFGDQITVSTGLVERTWRWTGRGLATSSLKDLRTGKEWVNTPAGDSDWEATGVVGDLAGELLSLTAEPSDDDNFTSKHLRVRARIRYPSSATVLRYEIWAYPGSEGLRTQLWLRKEEAGKGGESELEVTVPTFSAVSGYSFVARKALQVADAWHAASLQHEKQVSIKLEGIDPGKSYHLGMSWWDYGNGGRIQSVRATSIDGEVQKMLVKPTVLPGWTKDKKPAASFVVALPSEVNMDGSATLLVEKSKGPNAVVCEAWLYGPGPSPDLEIDDKRRAELEKMAPEGTVLISYFDAGKKQAKQVIHREARSEFLPVKAQSYRAMGYFNDTQNRHSAETHMVRDEKVKPGRVDWASILCLEAPEGGLALVKESHKCVNQSGVKTGAFQAGDQGVAVTGWGLAANEISTRFRWCWANWTVLYPEPTSDAREMALKRFDRTRYSVSPERDLYMKANTWGSGINQPASFARAKEDEVLAEIDSVADLGLDALQIDDGWQVGRMKPKNPNLREWQVRPDWYPGGWKNVVDRAAAKDIDLGIWFAARAPLEDLTASYDQAGFKTYKLDFANLSQYSGVESYLDKGRSLVAYSKHRAKVNWDVTEIAPRFGYFWARECGSIWLANRKPMKPDNVVPRPWLMLRETWELARYMNTNRFELPVQNFRRVNTKVSDAHLHSDTYSVALGLSGIPVFFQTTRLLEDDQRKEIKALLEPYRKVRSELFERYVFPIGTEPDNKSWAGFQWVDPDSQVGFLLVFRERLNGKEQYKMPLRFVGFNKRLNFKNLRSGESSSLLLDADGAAELRIEKPGEVLFLRYEME